MAKLGVSSRPYPIAHPKHKPDLAYAIQKRRDQVYIADLPSVHKTEKLATVANLSDLGVDYVFIDANGAIQAQGNKPSGSVKDFVLQNSFVGVTNPHWRDQVRNGQNATTNASGIKFNFSNPFLSAEALSTDKTGSPAFKWRYHIDWYGRPTMTLPPTPAISNSDYDFASNRAISKFLDAMDSVFTSVEAGQDFGEWKQTVAGVTKPLQSLRNHTLGYFDKLSSLKRSYKSPSVKFHKAVTDAYLEWTFGWKPLAGDVAAGLVGLQNRSRQFEVVPIKKGFKLDYASSTDSAWGYNVDNAGLLKLSRQRRNSSSIIFSYRGAVRNQWGKDPIPIHNVLQLDLPHFVPTVWDLIPYSFVVDYFVNVGDIVRSYSLNTTQLSWVNRTEIRIHRTDTVWTIDSYQNPGMTYLQLKEDTGNSFIENRSFNRQVIDASFLHPVLQFHLPTSEKPWENIAALLANRIRSIVPLRFL